MKDLLGLLIVTAWFSCGNHQAPGDIQTAANPMDRLPNNAAGSVARKAIEHAGGWQEWSSKRNFSFYKVITQLDSSGQIKKRVRQLHQYNLEDGFQCRMTWSDDLGNYVIINTGKEARKYKDDHQLTDDKSNNEAWNSSFGSNYVISMPFKLTDPGIKLSYEGIDSTTLDQPVHALKVEYEKGAGSSGGYHTWYYYFDLQNHDMVANYLDYGEGHSLTTYETFTEVDGIRLHLRRLSYSSNADKEKVLLRTIYENEEMHFDNAFHQTMFTFP